MNVTLDGFMAGPEAELDWHFRSWCNDMAESISEELAKADTIILGRVTYSAMENYWRIQTNALTVARDDMAFADMINRYKKIVVSTTLHRTHWYNAEIISKNITRTIEKLKRSAGKNIIIYGSGTLVSCLIKQRIVDEFILWIHPVLLGKGKPFFRELNDEIKLQLVQRMSFSSGVIALKYSVFGGVKSRKQNHQVPRQPRIISI
jgi:dihydrofolate reductase